MVFTQSSVVPQLKQCCTPTRLSPHFPPCWQQRDLVIFGRTVAQPRLIAYMADPTTPPYTYSGLTLQPMPWTEVCVFNVLLPSVLWS